MSGDYICYVLKLHISALLAIMCQIPQVTHTPSWSNKDIGKLNTRNLLMFNGKSKISQ